MVGGYIVLAVAVTWPLARELTTHLPVGLEPSATVARFNLWTMEWNARSLGDLLAGYWDAPIFWPEDGSFAWSEPQPLTGVVYTVLRWVVGPATSYGLLVLGALTLNGLAIEGLARRLGVARVPAVATGALGVALPFVLAELGVLQLLMVFPLVFALAALFDLAAAHEQGEPLWGPALRLGAWLAVTALTCSYYAAFAVVVVPAAAIALLGRRLLRRSMLAALGLAMVAAVVPALPVLVGQAVHTTGQGWSAETVRSLSADPGAWLRSPGPAVADALPWVAAGGVPALWPGTVLVVGGAAGAVVGLRRPSRRRMLALLVVLAVAAMLAGGLAVTVAGWAPWSVLRDHVPGFDRIRSPFRLAVVVQVVLVVATGVAMDAIWRAARAPSGGDGRAVGDHERRRLRGRGLVGVALVVVLVGAAVLETRVAPSIDPVPVAAMIEPGWAEALAVLPPGPVLAVPVPADGTASAYEDTTAVLLGLLPLAEGFPTIGGYTGIFPASWLRARSVLTGLPDRGLALLRVRGVRWLVVRTDWLSPERLRVVEGQGVVVRYADRDRTLLEVPDPLPTQ